MYLQIPPAAKTCELINSTIWFEDGILYSRYNDAPYVLSDREQLEEEMKKFKEFAGDQKVLLLIESHPNAESVKKEDRDYVSERLASAVKAMAILTPSAVSRMIVNLFFLFKPPSFPTKMFQDISQAKKWLQTVKNQGPVIPVI